MKKLIVASTLGSLFALNFAQAAGMKPRSATPDRVTIFQVSLQCPAAPQIGCGSAAKPILLKLERDATVQEAWLNRAGTLIAVVWKSGLDAESRRGVKSRLQFAGCCAKGEEVTEIKGEARAKALKEFESGRGWYRGKEVDQLSEEEAGIIATRLVQRVQEKTILAKDKAERLRRALAKALRKCFLEGRDQVALSIDQLAGDFLDKKQMATLEEAIGKGVRPLPNEN
jgi:hypothetical protein